jgi:precorrin-6A synthase
VRKLYVIGIGAGDPEYLTIQAVSALNKVDVFFVMDKGPRTADLLHLRRHICEKYIVDREYRMVEVPDPVRDPSISPYASRVEEWHLERLALYERIISEELAEGDSGAFLVWGDPSLYDSTLRVIDTMIARGVVTFEYDVIPGISSVQALAAKHKIALNRIGGAVGITTGHLLSEKSLREMDDVVVMLDGNCSFKNIDCTEFDIYWGAYLGTQSEIIIAGRACDIAGEIERVRSEARARNGWIMDTYLLRRRRAVSDQEGR